MRVIVDRIENEYIIVELENGDIANMPRVLASDAKDGDIIEIEIKKEETEARKKELKDFYSQLFEE